MTSFLIMGAMTSGGCQHEPAEAGRGRPGVEGDAVGMVVDALTGVATVFDAETNEILGTVPGLGGALDAPGDCSITADGTKGFFTSFRSSVTVADLTTTPPTQAGAPNPIPIANPGEDTALSPNGRFLLVCDGATLTPVSVIDVATQREISTFHLGSYCTSVDVCGDGSVLVTTFNGVRRLALSGSGVLTDTGASLSAVDPGNVYCAPAATAGIALENGNNRMISFKLPELTLVSARDLARVLTGAINHAGDRAYVRTGEGGPGQPARLSAWRFDQATGALGSAPLFQVETAPVAPFWGIDQVAVHPSDASLYVSESGALRIFDATTGAVTGSIVGESMSQIAGVCFGGAAADGPPVAKCADRTVTADARCRGSASVDAGSFDPGGGPLTCTQTPPGPYGRGETSVTLTCTDRDDERASCTAKVTVVDRTPPRVIATDPGSLWPPDHKYRRIDLDDCIASIRDACDGTLDIASHATVTCCTSDEPDVGVGGGDLPGDCVILDGDSVAVRAERRGTGNGRVYTIHYTVTDDADNAAGHTCIVTVPRSQGGGPAVDDGPQTTCP